MSTPFGQFTLDIILSAGFGLKADVQTNTADPELVKKALSVFMVPVYIRALTMFPFYRHLKKIFDLNPIQHVPYFAKLARDILELRRSGSVGRRDLVQLMLEATEESNNEVKTLTDEEIIGQSITFLVAGSETTGSTLALIAYHLAYYPEIQERLLREIDDATRSRGDVSIYEFVQSLEYLDRVVSEVLRLCTVGYVNVRDCMETCVINGVEFPAGSCVYILSYCVHRDPDYWPEVDCLSIIIILLCTRANSLCIRQLYFNPSRQPLSMACLQSSERGSYRSEPGARVRLENIGGSDSRWGGLNLISAWRHFASTKPDIWRCKVAVSMKKS